MNNTEEMVVEEVDPRKIQAYERCYRTILSVPRPSDGKNSLSTTIKRLFIRQKAPNSLFKCWLAIVRVN